MVMWGSLGNSVIVVSMFCRLVGLCSGVSGVVVWIVLIIWLLMCVVWVNSLLLCIIWWLMLWSLLFVVFCIIGSNWVRVVWWLVLGIIRLLLLLLCF